MKAECWRILCFWIVVLEKTLESPLDSKEIKPVSLKGNQPWIFIRKTDAETETPRSEVSQSCPTLWDSMDCSLPGSSLHGIFQARVLEWVAISFSRGSSRPRDWIQVSSIAGRCFTIWATRETPVLWPTDMKSWLTVKDPDARKDRGQEKWVTEDEMVGWYHWINMSWTWAGTNSGR